jgi:L-iditol 2-dehydrogenase
MRNYMKAWVYRSSKRSLKLTKLKVPEPKNEGELLIKVKACGICGSDLHLFRTTFRPRALLRILLKPNVVKRPKILGHEISGVVVDSKDEKFRVGDRVAIFPKTPLGDMGDTLPGGFAEYIIVPSSSVLRIPGHVSYEEGALLEPLGSALHAVRKLDGIKAERALVIGAGTIGLLVLQLLKHMKVVDEVYVTDKVPFKLSVAKDLGAERTLMPGELLNYGNYFDIVFEAVGGFAIELTLNQAIHAIRNKGIIILLGAVEVSPKVKLGIFHAKEGSLIGSFSLTWRDYTDAYNLVVSRNVELLRLVTHRFPLIDAPKAIRTALKGNSIKVMLMSGE